MWRHDKNSHFENIPPKHTNIPPTIEQATLDNPDQSSSNFSASTQSRINQFSSVNKPISASEKQSLDRFLLITICNDYFPFSVVEGKSFHLFLKNLNPNYTLPSRKTLSNSLLPSIYNETFSMIKSKLASVKYITVTSDGWNNLDKKSFYELTAHFIDEDFEMNSYMLQCEEFKQTHTRQHIAEWLKTKSKQL